MRSLIHTLRDDPRRCTAPERFLAAARNRGVHLDHLDDMGVAIALWHTQPSPDASLPPILLLHGATYSSLSVFDLAVPGRPAGDYSVAARLRDRGHQVFMLDFSGYGFSATPERAETHLDHHRQADLALQHVIARTGRLPVVVGWSWGAQIAGRLAEYARDRLLGAVMWGGVWDAGPPVLAARPTPQATEDRRKTNSIGHAASDFSTPGHYDDAIRTAFCEIALALDPTSPRTPATAPGGAFSMFDPRRIRVPTLVIHASEDRAVARNDIAPMMALFPAGLARNVIIARADHNIQHGFRRSCLIDEIARFAAALAPQSGRFQRRTGARTERVR